MADWRSSSTIGLMLRRFRMAHNLTERRLAEQLGKPGQAGVVTVNRWSNGKRAPSRRLLGLALAGLEQEIGKKG